ncbi:DinB family protein [Nocardioides sp.]|uniref:DinB family protein n=1 Tax=Nocardioides sp. TaxID=35761 RepID=UPI0025FA66F0|nr:DinB family protein [Nocardioides sp.]
MTTERDDILDLLTKHRGFLTYTVQGLSDEAARSRPTVSALSLGGLIKHVTAVERNWADFVVNGAANQPDWASVDWSNPPPEILAHQQAFVMSEDETLAEILAAYAEVAAATDELVRTVDLDTAHSLPEAPWAAATTWSARRAILHIALETAQHAGHADIIRETIDGQKTMG